MNELMSTDDRILWAACAACPSLTHNSLRSLFVFFQSGISAWNASHHTLMSAGLSHQSASKFVDFRASFSLDQLAHSLSSQYISIILESDPTYPLLLSHITDPPSVLFVRGQLNTHIAHPLAVVGSRKISTYGKQLIDHVVSPCVQAGCSIVSGLALGADGLAHEAALAHDGYTVAVLGTGIDDTSIYPKQHYHLAQRILASGGALISEFAPGTPGSKHHFPLRNRIIAGLSEVIYVVEAAERSGSLITARVALDYNRIVCTSPGSIFSEQSKGCNALISAGAKPIMRASDLLDEFSLDAKVTHYSYEPQNDIERLILEHLTDSPTHIDALISATNCSASVLMTTLTLLETKRIVKQTTGMTYILSTL